MNKTGNMTSGGIFAPLLSFAWPIVLGNFLMQLYVTFDALIVGRLLGEKMLAVLSVATPVYFIVSAFLTGGCLGMSVLISQLYGAGKEERLRETFSTGVLAGGVFSLFITALCLSCTRSVLVATGVPEVLHDGVENYLRVAFGGLIFTFLYTYYASGLRGIGNSKIPFLFQMLAAVLQMVLDVLLVGYLNCGVLGSAWAMVLTMAFSTVATYCYIACREPLLALHRGEYRVTLRALKDSVTYSYSVAFQSIIVYLGRFMTQVCVNPLGPGPVAGYNVATRIETLSVRPFEGVSTALSTFVAQNVGAGSVSRVKRGFNAAAVLSFSYTLVMCVTLFYSGNRLLGFFLPADASGVMVSSGGNYLHLMALYLPLSALCGLLQALYRGLNRFRIVLILSVFQIVLRIMLSFRLVPVYGVPAIAHATVIGWILIAIYMGMGAWRYFRATCQE